MTYNQILLELKQIGIDKAFKYEFESYVSKELLVMIKDTDKIKSTASLIKLLLKKFKTDTEEFVYWKKVFIYFMTPVFARNLNQLI